MGAEKIHFNELSRSDRRMLRLVRHKLFELNTKKPFYKKPDIEKIKNEITKFVGDSKLSIPIEVFQDITLYNCYPSGKARPLIWAYEFSENYYPDVSNGIKALVEITSHLDSDFGLLFIDTIDQVSTKLSDAIVKNLLDYNQLNQLQTLEIQSFLRNQNTKIISDSMKLLPDNLNQRIISSISKRNRAIILKDISFHDQLENYVAFRSLFDLMSSFFREKGKIRKTEIKNET